MTRIALLLMLTVFGLLFVTNTAMAADTRASLEASIKARFPQLEKYRNQGKVGEVFDGTTQYVKDEYASDATLKDLMTAENADRKALFAIIAKEENGKVEDVAKAYARRLFELAKPEHYLKGKSGAWVKKSDVMGR